MKVFEIDKALHSISGDWALILLQHYQQAHAVLKPITISSPKLVKRWTRSKNAGWSTLKTEGGYDEAQSTYIAGYVVLDDTSQIMTQVKLLRC